MLVTEVRSRMDDVRKGVEHYSPNEHAIREIVEAILTLSLQVESLEGKIKARGSDLE